MMRSPNITPARVVDMKSAHLNRAREIVRTGGADGLEFVTAAEVLVRDGNADDKYVGLFVLREYRPIRSVQEPINARQIEAEGHGLRIRDVVGGLSCFGVLFLSLIYFR